MYNSKKQFYIFRQMNEVLGISQHINHNLQPFILKLKAYDKKWEWIKKLWRMEKENTLKCFRYIPYLLA